MGAVLGEKEQNILPETCEDDVSAYLRQIRSVPRLTPEQELSLAKRCAAGDEDAVRAIVSANLRLVVSIAREYEGWRVPLTDLMQEGSIGLITAAKKFDYTRNCRFSTYATDWIRQCIQRYIENQNGLIRVPRHTAERIRKLQKAHALLQQRGQVPTAANIAQLTGIEEEKVTQYLALIPEVGSLDTLVGDQQDTLGELLENVQSPQPQEELVRRELKTIMDTMLDILPERERQVLRLRFGMEDGTSYSLEKIGVMLGVSKERARQLQNQAMERMQKLGADFGLEDFLE